MHVPRRAIGWSSASDDSDCEFIRPRTGAAATWFDLRSADASRDEPLAAVLPVWVLLELDVRAGALLEPVMLRRFAARLRILLDRGRTVEPDAMEDAEPDGEADNGRSWAVPEVELGVGSGTV